MRNLSFPIPKRWWLIGAVLILIVAVVLVRTRNGTTPLSTGATTTARLIATIDSLEDSFSSLKTPNGQVTQQYLKTMVAIQTDCRSIRGAFDVENKGVLAGDAKVRGLLKASQSVCADLAPLAASTASTYRATLPLLTAGTDLRVYQTLPLVKDVKRRRNLTEAGTAIRALTALSPREGEYPSAAMPLTLKLQATIKDSKDLGYLPALRVYQDQLLAERQQYWSTYADLSSLRQELNKQFATYCRVLHATGHDQPTCHAIFR